MKKKALILILFACIFTQACTVLSFYPLYTKDTLIRYDKIIGEWETVESDKNSTSPSSKWKITFPTKITPPTSTETIKENKFTYHLTITENNKSKGTFALHCVKIGNDIYADFYPIDWDNEDYFVEMHRFAAHTFAKITFDKQLKFEWLNNEWLEKNISQNKIHIRHENNGNQSMITASSEELQEFLRKFSHRKDAFKEGAKIVLKQ